METKINDDLSIIIIDDNQGDYFLIEDFLYEEFKRITIKHYTDYKSFSADFKNQENNCSLILLDLSLPDLSGLELINNIIITCPHIPIIILTGYSDIPLAKKSLELGIYDFLVKDEINPVILHKSIEFAISRSNYVRQIESQIEILRNIAWTQSHVVRAPLARILGIINLINVLDGDNTELPLLLEQLKLSSYEMDDIVQKIVMETKSLDINK